MIRGTNAFLHAHLTGNGELVGLCLCQGEKVTWTKLSAIQAACGIELAFDRCLAVVKAADMAEREGGAGGVASAMASARSGRLGGMRSRIPSWSFLTCAPFLKHMTFYMCSVPTQQRIVGSHQVHTVSPLLA